MALGYVMVKMIVKHHPNGRHCYSHHGPFALVAPLVIHSMTTSHATKSPWSSGKRNFYKR